MMFRLFCSFCCFLFLPLTLPPAFGSPAVSGDSLSADYVIARAESLIASNPDSALQLLRKGQLLLNEEMESGDQLWAKLHLLTGQAQFEKGFYTLALTNYFSALSVVEKQRNQAEEARLNLRIGLIHSNLSELDKAETFYLKAAGYYLQSEDSAGTAEVCNRLGVLYAQRRDRGKAFDYLQKALVIDSLLNNSLMLARTLNNLGYACNLFAQPARAVVYLQKAKSIKEEASASDISLCPTLNNLGVSYLQLNQVDKALEYSFESLSMAEENQLLNRQQEALKNIAAAYTVIEDYKNALHYTNLFHDIQEQIRSAENIRRNFELENKFKEEQQQREYEQARVQLMERREAQYSFVLALIFSCLLLVAVLGKAKIQRKHYRSLTFLVLLLFFEAVMIFSDKAFDQYVGEGPAWALAFNFFVAVLFVPVNGFLQKRLSKMIPDKILNPAGVQKIWKKSKKLSDPLPDS